MFRYSVAPRSLSLTKSIGKAEIFEILHNVLLSAIQTKVDDSESCSFLITGLVMLHCWKEINLCFDEVDIRFGSLIMNEANKVAILIQRLRGHFARYFQIA